MPCVILLLLSILHIRSGQVISIVTRARGVVRKYLLLLFSVTTILLLLNMLWRLVAPAHLVSNGFWKLLEVISLLDSRRWRCMLLVVVFSVALVVHLGRYLWWWGNSTGILTNRIHINLFHYLKCFK